MNEKIQRCIFKYSILFCLLSLSLNAREHIVSFESDITVHQDSTLTVIETIRVLVEGDAIKHGIVREFPTRYKGSWGTTAGVGFTVQRVERDGIREPYFIEHASHGERVFIGSKNRRVSLGEHVYRIAYTTDFQLGFFTTHDELYWNVTGNGWRFPIDKATALVHLPQEIPLSAVRAEGYTGFAGFVEQNYTVRTKDNTLFFETTALGQYQGFTLVVTWPKGYIIEPSFIKKAYHIFKYNSGIICMIMGILIVLIFYSSAYIRMRKKDRPGIVIPLYTPPHELAPSAMRYIARMSYDSKTLVAELVNMAVKGFLTIEYTAHTYTLKKNEKEKQTYKMGTLLSNKLFSQADTIKLTGYSTSVDSAHEELRKSLVFDAQNHNYFDFHARTLCAGIILFLIACIPVVAHGAWPEFFMGGIVFAGIALIFFYLFRRYTPEGRKIKDAIDGFKMFLSVTETERLRVLSSPHEAVSEYERYLPYAIALDVEENWTKQFVPIFEQLARAGTAYVPVWYYGRHFDARHMDDFSRTLSNSFAGAISSATTVPGSTSGSGGRGSSGGGGGGGGGGGW